MSYTADQIEAIVNELITLKKDHTVEQINQLDKFTDFKTKNRIFYEMTISQEGMDFNIFKEMMKMKRRLESGEDQYSVDVRFGKFMAEKYIDPLTHKMVQKPI
jgi:hypothetical protein